MIKKPFIKYYSRHRQEKILVAGFGGQGIMLLGKIIAEIGLLQDKFITYLKSYGAEMRGGTAHCFIRVSRKPIASPIFNYPTIAVIMNQPSLDKFADSFRQDTFVLVNASLAKCRHGSKFISCSYPFDEEAISLGSIKVANIVALGSLIKKISLAKKQSVMDILKRHFISQPAILDLDLKAFNCGWKIA